MTPTSRGGGGREGPGRQWEAGLREGRGPPRAVQPYPLMHGRSRARVLLGPAGGRVAGGHAADGHFSVALALGPLHAYKLHVAVLVEAERQLLGHAGCHAHLQAGRQGHGVRQAGCPLPGGSSSRATLPQEAPEGHQPRSGETQPQLTRAHPQGGAVPAPWHPCLTPSRPDHHTLSGDRDHLLVPCPGVERGHPGRSPAAGGHPSTWTPLPSVPSVGDQ